MYRYLTQRKEHTDSLFYKQDYSEEKPTTIHGWKWSLSVPHWAALVTFADGWQGFTHPVEG